MARKKKKRISNNRFSKLPRRKNPSNPSVFSHIIDQHYQTLGLKNLWDKERVDRLVGFMRIKDRDLASMINMPYTLFEQMTRTGTVTGPSALLLAIIENQVMKDFVNDTINIWDFPWST